MVIVSTIFLLDLNSVMRFDILAWFLGVPVVLAAVVWLYFQQRQTRQLQDELSQLSRIKRHTVEYELVLKAMKISIWRLDVATRTVTFDSDYRDAADSIVFPPATSLDVIIGMLVPEYVEAFKQNSEDLLTGRIDEVHMQYEIRVPHSDRIYWSESYATVDKRDLHGNPLTIVGTSVRIDKQKEIERELIVARNQAEESDRLKSAFLANISHEIRTPLNAIVGFSDVLPMVETKEERDQLIELIKTNNAHLLRLFDDMVHMSKLEAGGETIKKNRFDVKLLLSEVAERYSKLVDPNRVKLHVAETDGNLEVYSDRGRLIEIMNQYVNNAVKFTEDGSITIGAELQNKILHMWVQDTGKGIPEDRCNDHLFERFVKVDEFVPGTGLGLSICRSMALSLGGKVGMQSTLGEGSLFWADIPIEYNI